MASEPAWPSHPALVRSGNPVAHSSGEPPWAECCRRRSCPRDGAGGGVDAAAALGSDLSRSFPSLAAAAVGLTLVALWWDGRRDYGATHVTVRAVAYAAVLSLVAWAYVVADRTRTRVRLADTWVEETTLSGLPGLTVALREAVGDPTLQVREVDDALDAGAAPQARRLLPVDDASGRIAVVDHDAAASDDPVMASAVADAVRLVVSNARLTREELCRLGDLEAARARLVAVTDRERATTAERLRTQVGAPLQGAVLASRAARTCDGASVADALDVAVGELTAADREISAVVAGVPPAGLGSGRLVQALRAMADRSPVPVHVYVAPNAAAAAVVETALFYVCFEAVTNAIKNASAASVDCRVERDGDRVVLRVRDGGTGGADPSGSGLLGLADRVAAVGGRLRVDSPSGAGTEVVAVLLAQL